MQFMDVAALLAGIGLFSLGASALACLLFGARLARHSNRMALLRWMRSLSDHTIFKKSDASPAANHPDSGDSRSRDVAIPDAPQGPAVPPISATSERSPLSASLSEDARLLRQIGAEMYQAGDLSTKPSLYLDEYANLFGPVRELPLRIFEIGVQRGVSMKMWEKFFPNATIVGLDGDPQPSGFPQSPRFHFVQAWQDDAAAMQKAVQLAGGPFDIIIDDASHLGCHTARSFALLFPYALKAGGYYVLEDICTAFNYPSDYDAAPFNPPVIGCEGMPKVFPSHQHGMVGLLKQMVDHAMAPTAAGGYTQFPIQRVCALTNIAFLQKA